MVAGSPKMLIPDSFTLSAINSVLYKINAVKILNIVRPYNVCLLWNMDDRYRKKIPTSKSVVKIWLPAYIKYVDAKAIKLTTISDHTHHFLFLKENTLCSR